MACPDEHVDHYNEALEKMIEQKLKSKSRGTKYTAKTTAGTKSGKVVDLMEALQRSINSLESKGKSSAKPSNKAAATKKTKTTRSTGRRKAS